MRIDRVECGLYAIPLPSVLTDARHGEMREFALVTVEVHTAGGASGLGYTYTVGRTGAPAVLSLIRDDLAPLLNGRDPRHTERLWSDMWWRLHYCGRGAPASFAISAADIALWDLKAKLAGEPLWRLLGGYDPRVRAYAGGIDLMLSADELAEAARRNLERGFRAVKIKVGRERLADDLERLARAREVLGPDLPLLADANMRWSQAEAIRASRAFAAYDVFWLEEPTAPDDFEGHARIAREGPLPIAAGENLHTLAEFRRLIAAGGVSYPEPDVSNVGGVTAWLKVAHLAEAFNLEVTSHGVHDLHVHLLAAVPNASFLEVHGFGLEPYLRHPLEIRDGFATAPERPGHGVEFDWKALAKLKLA